jgi:hypothetical protein
MQYFSFPYNKNVTSITPYFQLLNQSLLVDIQADTQDCSHVSCYLYFG